MKGPQSNLRPFLLSMNKEDLTGRGVMENERRTLAEDIIIHPRRAKREKAVPCCGIMLVTPAEMQHGRSHVLEAGGREQFMYGSTLAIAAGERYFITGPAVGAPVAVMNLEKVIALGARRIIMYGWCGAIDDRLQVGDVVVGGAPVSGEGTSRYYPTQGVPMPSRELCSTLGAALGRAGITYTQGSIWSTDAPYREERTMIRDLHQNAGVACVDMEYSALCAAAAFRGVEFAALLLVSDELYRREWTPGYVRAEFRQKSRQLVDLLLAGDIWGGV